MEHAARPLHDCPPASSADFAPLTNCANAVGFDPVAFVAAVAIVLGLAGLGFAIWKWMQSRGA